MYDVYCVCRMYHLKIKLIKVNIYYVVKPYHNANHITSSIHIRGSIMYVKAKKIIQNLDVCAGVVNLRWLARMRGSRDKSTQKQKIGIKIY